MLIVFLRLTRQWVPTYYFPKSPLPPSTPLFCSMLLNYSRALRAFRQTLGGHEDILLFDGSGTANGDPPSPLESYELGF